MSDDQREKGFGGFFKTLIEIAGYVATLTPFLLTLLGRGSIPYPTFASIFALAISALAIWSWRWPAITKTRAKKSGKLKVQDYFRTSNARLFTMPLARRRIELSVLLLFAFGTLGGAGVNFISIREELTGFHCLSDEHNFRVVITDFSADSTFEDDLAAILHHQSGNRFQICRYRKQVRLPDIAQKEGEDHGADLIVWGISNQDRVNIYLTAIDWETLSQRHGGLSMGQSPEEAAFLAEIISAEILFNQGEAVTAQNSLYDALDAAEAQTWKQAKPALLAEGYFELGLLFDPYSVPANDADTQRALEEYSHAIEIIRQHDLELEGAYLNRAQLYSDRGDFERALKDYSALIDQGSEQSNWLHMLRAQIFIQMERCSDAIQELENVNRQEDIELDVVFPYSTFYLGFAYLACGEIELAEKTYQTMPVLSKDDAQAFLAGLESMAGTSADPAVKEAIDRIMDHIKQLHAQ